MTNGNRFMQQISQKQIYRQKALNKTFSADKLDRKIAAICDDKATGNNCADCHVPPTAPTCNGCHAHGTHSSSAKSDINVENLKTHVIGNTGVVIL
jgi:hypothetical protein